MSKPEELFMWQLRVSGLPLPEREYKFHAERRWRFDFCWPDLCLAVEIEGLNPNGKSRHTTVTGFAKDCEKYNEAGLLGYVVLRFTQNQVKSGEALAGIERYLAQWAVAMETAESMELSVATKRLH